VTEAERAPLLRALSPVPQDRYPTCGEFMSELLRAHGLKIVPGEDGGPCRVRRDRGSAPTSHEIRSGSGPHRKLGS
jgi:hypothetical protein